VPVARHHFVRQRKPIPVYRQTHQHLLAVAAMIAPVPPPRLRVAQRLVILLGATTPWPGLHLGDERFQFRIRAGGGEQVLLAGEGVLQLAGEFEPLLFGTRGQVAERADDLLAGALGGEAAFDEEVVAVGLAANGPRGFADVHTLDTITNDVKE
jgi:hypothetical protein